MNLTWHVAEINHMVEWFETCYISSNAFGIHGIYFQNEEITGQNEDCIWICICCPFWLLQWTDRRQWSTLWTCKISKTKLIGECSRQIHRRCFISSLKFWLAWWRHQMETFSALLAVCVGKSSVTGELLTQRPVTRSFVVFFDLCLGWTVE